MKVIAGLGNPGAKYELTRHNVGFLAVDQLIEHWGARSTKKTKKEELFEAKFGGEKIAIIKPLTYMNLSGESIVPFCRFFKVEPKDFLVVYDDLDLLPAQLKLKVGGGTGGHNGLKSIDEHWGSVSYSKVRIGIGKPATVGSKLDTSDYVLQKFPNQELDQLEPVFNHVIQACELWVKNQFKEAMNQFNQKVSKDT